MTLITSLRAGLARATEAARSVARVYVVGGPVGVFYALQLARVRRRLARVSVQIHRENELHRENLRTLNFELTTLVQTQQAMSQAAGEFWRATGTVEPS